MLPPGITEVYHGVLLTPGACSYIEHPASPSGQQGMWAKQGTVSNMFPYVYLFNTDDTVKFHWFFPIDSGYADEGANSHAWELLLYNGDTANTGTIGYLIDTKNVSISTNEMEADGTYGNIIDNAVADITSYDTDDLIIHDCGAVDSGSSWDDSLATPTVGDIVMVRLTFDATGTSANDNMGFVGLRYYKDIYA